MTSTGAERLFALGHVHDVCAGASRDDTRVGVILCHADGTGPSCASAQTARRSGNCCARGRGRASSRPQGDHAGEAHSSGLGAARNSQGLACREARKARSKGRQARAYRSSAACRAVIRPGADGHTCGTNSRSTRSWARLASRSPCPTAWDTCCSCKHCPSRPIGKQTTLRTAPPASTAAAFCAA
eukprot:6206125-Pleurochrysis_carterae.AAC.5